MVRDDIGLGGDLWDLPPPISVVLTPASIISGDKSASAAKVIVLDI